MTTVNGEPAPGNENESREGTEGLVRRTRTELKHCKALAALNPPHHLSVSLHARITELLRTLKRYGSEDQDVTQPADLTNQELRQAASIIKALRAALPGKALTGGNGLRYSLGEYALDIADETDNRRGDEQ